MWPREVKKHRHSAVRLAIYSLLCNLIKFTAQHYHRVAAPGINKGSWPKGNGFRSLRDSLNCDNLIPIYIDEDDKLASLFQQYGACWSQVSKYMPKRTGTHPLQIETLSLQSFNYLINMHYIDTQCARRWAKVEHMYQKDGTRRLSERSIRIVRKDDSVVSITLACIRLQFPNNYDTYLVGRRQHPSSPRKRSNDPGQSGRKRDCLDVNEDQK